MMLRIDHDCEINIKQDEVLFLPSKGPFQKILGVLRRFFMVSQKSPSAQRHLRSRASITCEKRRHLRHYKHIIHPFSLFRHWWDFVMIFVIAGALLIIPYQAAFDMTRTATRWTIIKNVVHAICCMDILINFVTGYYDKTLRIVQLKQKQIILQYIFHGTFLADISGSFPTDILYLNTWDTLIVIREISSLIYVFRIFSIHSYIDKLAHAYDISRGLYEFCSMTFWLTLAVHWQACIHWIVPIATMSMKLPTKPQQDSWINVDNLWDADAQKQYSSSLFRSVAIFTRAGTIPHTIEDQYVVIVMHILGTLLFCITVARTMQFFNGANSSKLKYQAMMAQLKQYMRHKQLSHVTQRRFITYYEFRFQNRYFREHEILSTLSVQIRQEIGMHSCRKLVENVTFFNNLSMTLLVQIVALLHSEIFLANDVIIRANQPGDCMYFIATGTVAIYTSSGREVCHLEDGAHFGEIALVMPDERRVASVVAVELCELYRLDRADFARTIHPYPMLWERIKKIAMERHEETMILNAQ